MLLYQLSFQTKLGKPRLHVRLTLLRSRSQEYISDMEGCSRGPHKEGAIGNTLPQKGILTKQGTYVMTILGAGIFEQLPYVRRSNHNRTSSYACQRGPHAFKLQNPASPGLKLTALKSSICNPIQPKPSKPYESYKPQTLDLTRDSPDSTHTSRP